MATTNPAGGQASFRPRSLESWIDIPAPAVQLSEALLFQLQYTERGDPDRLAADQREVLDELVDHARSTVPYYADIATLWDEIQVLTASHLAAAGPELRPATALGAEHGRVATIRTDTSDGRSIEVDVTERAAAYRSAMAIRDHLWHARDLGRALAVLGAHPPDVARHPGVSSPNWGPATAPLFATGPAHRLNAAEPVDTQWRWLAERAPGYLDTDAATLAALIAHDPNPPTTVQLQQVIVRGGVVTDTLRASVTERFGAETREFFERPECGPIALECPTGGHLHVCAEHVLVEILDHEGRPRPAPKEGRVVATPLHNFAMPLLRYDTGTRARFVSAPDCGLTLPALVRT